MLDAASSSDDLIQASHSGISQGAGMPDCLNYTRTGCCNYGVSCRFNHPPNKSLVDATYTRGKKVYPERAGEPECQFYLKTGNCKFGSSCKYDHPKEKAGILGKNSINAAGFPLRLGEKDCPYYMQTGTCKFGTTCKFNHPQPAYVFSSLTKICGSAMSIPSNPTFSTWSLAKAPFIPGLPLQRPCLLPMFAPPEGFLSMLGCITNQGQMRTGMLTPPLERKHQMMGAAPIYGVATPQNYHLPYDAATNFTYSFTMPEGSTYPERPGQLECKYFIKTGYCKFGTSCRFDHPKWKNCSLPHYTLSPMGFPQRPGTEPCTFYMQYGTCKFGTACRFDHPFTSLTYSPFHKPIKNFPIISYPQMHTSLKPLQSTMIEAGPYQQGYTETETAPNQKRTSTDLEIPEAATTGESRSNSAGQEAST